MGLGEGVGLLVGVGGCSDGTTSDISPEREGRGLGFGLGLLTGAGGWFPSCKFSDTVSPPKEPRGFFGGSLGSCLVVVGTGNSSPSPSMGGPDTAAASACLSLAVGFLGGWGLLKASLGGDGDAGISSTTSLWSVGVALGFVGGVGRVLEGSKGAEGRLPLLAMEGETLGDEEGDGGRGLVERGVPGGLS